MWGLWREAGNRLAGGGDVKKAERMKGYDEGAEEEEAMRICPYNDQQGGYLLSPPFLFSALLISSPSSLPLLCSLHTYSLPASFHLVVVLTDVSQLWLSASLSSLSFLLMFSRSDRELTPLACFSHPPHTLHRAASCAAGSASSLCLTVRYSATTTTRKTFERVLRLTEL